MAQLIDLRDLLKHEILDLYSAEEQIIEALPKMVDKANNTELKQALRDHLKITVQQKKRLNEIKNLMGEDQHEEDSKENKGFFSRLFGGSGSEKCKGTEGLIKEGEKMMKEDMTTEVMDAAIIAAAQKIEHYEISGYGTAAAYARELGLNNVAVLLQQTLNEEYQADDMLTLLAIGKLNIKAEFATPLSDQTSSAAKSGSFDKAGNSKSNSSKGSGAKVSEVPKNGNGSSKNNVQSNGSSSKNGNSLKNSKALKNSKDSKNRGTKEKFSNGNPPNGSSSKGKSILSTSPGNKSDGKSSIKPNGVSSKKNSSKSSTSNGKSKSAKRG